jgi:cell division protein FtsB
MREFQRKKKIRNYLYSPAVFVFVTILVAFLAKATWSVYVKERDSRVNMERAADALVALEARKRTLTQDIGKLQTAEGLEAEIRQQFQVARPGERIVVVVDESKQSEPVRVEKASLVSRFFDIFR